ncbi:MAG: putative formate dehydrogenase [Syntrophorhabdaceae bacterium PtaU1.Bin034]|nr:MAG: putative formate dehydrogenase [Syntrophorhabdaceae bacterium PtaU1.Bin034]
MDPIRFTIDGREVTGAEGETILEVALRHGIDIPYLCYHPRISKSGACRVCMVRVDQGKLRPSCTEEIKDGMNVVTEDEEIARTRKFVLELLLSEGDHNCLYCDANGDCQFQRLVTKYVKEPVPQSPQRTVREIDNTSSKAYRRNENKCILCGRCVKTCAEIQVSNVWALAERGSRTHLVSDAIYGASNCTNCGSCAQMCPTGALTLQKVLGEGQAWELTVESSICIYCGVGCKIDFYKNREGLLTKALGNPDGPNQGHLCVKGRFGFDFVQSNKRLKKPLIKRGGKFEEAPWDEALDLVAGTLMRIKTESGPDSIAGLASAKCTNEENYLMQKFLRAVVGTNNIDHCARL